MQREPRLLIANMIGVASADDGTAVHCGACGALTVPNVRGHVLIGPDNPWWLCDACAEQRAPQLMPLVRRLRACDGRFTIMVGSANLERDASALACPVCGAANAHSRDWHIVDAEHGRPICDQCIAGVDDAVRRLLADVLAADRPGADGATA